MRGRKRTNFGQLQSYTQNARHKMLQNHNIFLSRSLTSCSRKTNLKCCKYKINLYVFLVYKQTQLKNMRITELPISKIYDRSSTPLRKKIRSSKGVKLHQPCAFYDRIRCQITPHTHVHSKKNLSRKSRRPPGACTGHRTATAAAAGDAWPRPPDTASLQLAAVALWHRRVRAVCCDVAPLPWRPST